MMQKQLDARDHAFRTLHEDHQTLQIKFEIEQRNNILLKHELKKIKQQTLFNERPISSVKMNSPDPVFEYS